MVSACGCLVRPLKQSSTDTTSSKSTKTPLMQHARMLTQKLQSRRNPEHRLESKIKDDKKSFAYARWKAKTKIRMGPLVGPDGKEIKDVTQIAQNFNDQFSSVFTAQNVTDIPVPSNIFTGSDGGRLRDIIFTEEEVLKRLLCLQANKSASVDEMSSRFLKAVPQ